MTLPMPKPGLNVAIVGRIRDRQALAEDVAAALSRFSESPLCQLVEPLPLEASLWSSSQQIAWRLRAWDTLGDMRTRYDQGARLDRFSCSLGEGLPGDLDGERLLVRLSQLYPTLEFRVRARLAGRPPFAYVVRNGVISARQADLTRHREPRSDR